MLTAPAVHCPLGKTLVLRQQQPALRVGESENGRIVDTGRQIVHEGEVMAVVAQLSHHAMVGAFVDENPHAASVLPKEISSNSIQSAAKRKAACTSSGVRRGYASKT